MIHIKPDQILKPVKFGDEVHTAAVSSLISDEQSILNGLKIFESWGLKCRAQNVNNRYWGYFAGNDDIRLKDLHPIKIPEIIAFARGGWGAARLLEKNQSWNKGWLIGFSDVSALLLSRLAAGFDGCIHGPMLNSLAMEPDWSKKRLYSILFGESLPELNGKSWFKGISKGPLVVSNLTVATHLIGTKHMPDLNGSIMIFEDIGEAPYRVDRMLTHWRLAGLLQQLAGIGFGSFIKCEAPSDEPPERTFELEDVLKERCKDLGIPIVGNLPIGHHCGNAALPLGNNFLLDGNKGILKHLTC